MWQSFVFIVGKPVDEPRDVDYVPSRLFFKDDKKDLMAMKAWQTRVEQRRKLIEIGDSKKERRASAVEGLLLIQDSQFAIDAGIQCQWRIDEFQNLGALQLSPHIIIQTQ